MIYTARVLAHAVTARRSDLHAVCEIRLKRVIHVYWVDDLTASAADMTVMLRMNDELGTEWSCMQGHK